MHIVRVCAHVCNEVENVCRNNAFVHVVASKTDGRNVSEENCHAIEFSCVITLSSLYYLLDPLSPPLQLSTDPLGSSVMVTKLLQESSAY